ncbi:MAG: PSD1 and planctomycete cytochrome C domain-containing protein [Verrucomicrobiales bacterium]|nr:PSD1 and planctomycete cytochrome C domain-containing protein [Verrucomicrobiales bacterium]
MTAEQEAFFEAKIRPVLVDACYECHSNEGGRIKSGLALDSSEGLRMGGDSGAAIVAGNAQDSLLWLAISYSDPDYEMPPKKRLPAHVVEDFKKWIEMGAPDPRKSEKRVVKSHIDIEQGKKFWAFQKPQSIAAPKVKDENWVKGELDRFVLAKLEEAKMSPAERARPSALVRRLFFDLIGLPPSPDQAKLFASAWKKNPDAAVEDLVDQLLASEQFGERWARHWLDVARYAESSGKETNVTFPTAWRYRDYVIDSFNQDKPYDRFVREQVAGDLLPAKSDQEWQENLIATGFLAIGTKGLNQQSARQFKMDVVDEQIDTVTQAILGLTVSCARCHDHKFDPIPTQDYYAMAGIFMSTDTYFGTYAFAQNKRPSELLLLPLSDPVGDKISVEELAVLKERLRSMREEMASLRQQRGKSKGDEAAKALRKALRTRTALSKLELKVNGYREDGTPKSFAMGVQPSDSPSNARVLLRGEIAKPAQEVERGFLQVMQQGQGQVIKVSASGRLELADWLTSKDNTLTARVMVNRVWKNLFGKGLVASMDNFGTTGMAPTHPALLDYLAVDFMDHDWSVKKLIREIVLSSTYQMSSKFAANNYALDPDNLLLWRANQRRLDAESIRDAMLTASGELDLKRPRASAVAELGNERLGVRVGEDAFSQSSAHRSIYLPIVRDMVPEALALFDYADPGMVSGTRETTNVPLQALYMMNNTFVIEQARIMAELLQKKFPNSTQRLNAAFLRAYGRYPTKKETQQSVKFFDQFRATAGGSSQQQKETERLAMATFCQSLFSSAEFRLLN